MKTSRKRGRPKHNHPKYDTGTPELATKRRQGLTAEPLDICMQRGIISQDEHWAGIHLRWLYTVIFGAPTVSASDPSSLGGKDLREENIAWLRGCETEYAHAQRELHRCQALPLVPDICVFNRHPGFLYYQTKELKTLRAERHYEEYTTVKAGLEALFKLFSGRRRSI